MCIKKKKKEKKEKGQKLTLDAHHVKFSRCIEKGQELTLEAQHEILEM